MNIIWFVISISVACVFCDLVVLDGPYKGSRHRAPLFKSSPAPLKPFVNASLLVFQGTARDACNADTIGIESDQKNQILVVKGKGCFDEDIALAVGTVGFVALLAPTSYNVAGKNALSFWRSKTKSNIPIFDISVDIEDDELIKWKSVSIEPSDNPFESTLWKFQTVSLGIINQIMNIIKICLIAPRILNRIGTQTNTTIWIFLINESISSLLDSISSIDILGYLNILNYPSTIFLQNLVALGSMFSTYLMWYMSSRILAKARINKKKHNKNFYKIGHATIIFVAFCYIGVIIISAFAMSFTFVRTSVINISGILLVCGIQLYIGYSFFMARRVVVETMEKASKIAFKIEDNDSVNLERLTKYLQFSSIGIGVYLLLYVVVAIVRSLNYQILIPTCLGSFCVTAVGICQVLSLPKNPSSGSSNA